MSKRLLQYLVIGMFVAVLSGCAEAVLGTRPDAALSVVAGEWLAGPDDIGPSGWHMKRLTISPNGRFAATSASYGMYEGQARNDPSAWTRIEGEVRIDGNRLHFRPETMTWWDHFESADFPLPRRTAYPWGSLFDDATFIVEGRTLTLGFNVYPADAPLPVSEHYTRMASD